MGIIDFRLVLDAPNGAKRELLSMDGIKFKIHFKIYKIKKKSYY